jgi:hypothetical protein
MGSRAVAETQAGIRVIISAEVPMDLMLSEATSDEICEQSWPEFRRALKRAIDRERHQLRVIERLRR